ncbi:MAG: hypothetical protein ACOYL5_19235, partial [Phototrophicaceae bacterium]
MRAFGSWIKVPQHWVALALGFVPIWQMLRFSLTFTENLPTADTANRSIHVAIAVHKGALPLRLLFTPFDDHITVPTFLVTALTTALTDWNHYVEVAIALVLAVTAFTLLMMFTYHTEPAALAWVIFPAAALFFSLHQSVLWFVGYIGLSYFFVDCFILLVIGCIIFARERRWVLPLIWAIGILTTYTHGHGASVWPVMLLALLVNGERRWWVYLLTLSIGVGSVWGYSRFIAATGEAMGSGASITDALLQLPRVIAFSLAVLGNLVETLDVAPARNAGALALGLWLVNCAVIWWTKTYRHYLRLWLPMVTFSFVSVGVVALIRGGLGTPLAVSYLAMTTFFWVALVVSSVLLGLMAFQQRGRTVASLWAVNLLVWAYWGGGMVQSQTTTLDRLPEQIRFLNEPCHRAFIYTQDTIPQTSPCRIWFPDATNAIAFYDLALFAHLERQNMLSGLYEVGMPVIVESDNGWGNYHIQKWLLAGVAPDDIYHVTPALPINSIITEPIPLAHVGADPAALDANVFTSPSFWWIHRTDLVIAAPAFWQSLVDDGYLPTSFTYRTPEGVAFTVTNYQNIAALDSLSADFGDAMQLVAWNGGDIQATPCET